MQYLYIKFVAIVALSILSSPLLSSQGNLKNLISSKSSKLHQILLSDFKRVSRYNVIYSQGRIRRHLLKIKKA